MSGENTPRTADGQPASGGAWPRPTSDRPRVGRVGDWNNNSPSSSRSGSSRGIATLGSLGGGSSSRPTRRVTREGGDNDDDEKEGQNYFAGGERSGVSIQTPGNRDRAGPPGSARDLVQDLLRRAAEGGVAAAPEEPSRIFAGGGHTLGSEDVESTFIPDPNSNSEEDDEVAIRHLTLWREGFQIEDGELRRYDEPGNSELLAAINAGTAPLELLNARMGQRIELRVAKRTHDDFVPSASQKAFGGQGQRLGAPVPSFTPAADTASVPGAFPTSSAPEPSADRESITTRFEVDTDLPVTSVQIRLADGTRLPSRMNLTHTVGNIRNFINAARPENRTRPYTIGTTFPNRVLEDDSETIEAAKLQNSVIVQRWVQ
ncbi:hypothetical protein D9611_008910 [Ephemerocybe angulata]|uniref:SEP-domain-containing protein n=1 Tax=Ephemerocybe angulata TaxID=980116 RepID=A0A8H5FCV7_9AGAR|nr:hypothetical protein D9611_008910 [Tulosesus angulatus]